MLRRIVAGLACVSMVVVGLPLASGTASAAQGVRITSSGLSSMKTYTYRDSTSGYIIFDIADPRGVATHVSQCIVNPSGRRTNCDAYPLKNTRYRDGSWRVRSTPQGWTLRIYVGWSSSSREQCLEEYPGAPEWGLEIGVRAEDDRVLARRAHTYESDCQGYALLLEGPGALYLKVGSESRPLSIDFTIVDRAHAVRTVRRCFYEVDTGKSTNCYRDGVGQLGRQTKRGWSFTRNLTFRSVSQSGCREAARENPKYQYRVTLLDRNDRVLAQARHDFYLDCRG